MVTTIKDVARKAGVSITTVSHALNGYPDVSEKTRNKIIEVARQLDYVPNRNGRALGGILQPTVAFMLIGGLRETDPSGMTFGLLSGINDVVQKKGYNFVLLTASEKRQKELSFMQMCREKMVSGVVIYGLSTDAEYYSQIQKSNLPCVLVDMDLPGENNRMVAVNNEKAAYEEVCYMLEKGFKNIAMLNGKKVADVSEQRYKGYAAALEKYGKKVRPEWVADCGFDGTIGETMAMELMGRYPEIDAFFCASDVIAIGAVNGLGKLGLRIPEDVGIAGFDDIPISKYVAKGITSVAQNPFEMGRLCAKALLAMIQGEEVPHWIEAKYTLEKRSTTEKHSG